MDIFTVGKGGYRTGNPANDASSPKPLVSLSPSSTVPKKTTPKQSSSPVLTPTDPAQVTKGAQSFSLNCSACHQSDGKGLPGIAPSIRNRDFLAIASDEFILNTVRKGRLGTAMAPRPDLTKGTIRDIITYLRSEPVTNAITVKVNDSLKFVGNTKAGADKYSRYCSSCHGPNGEGYLAGVPGPGIGLPGFLDTVSDDYIFQTLKHGRIGTPMKSFIGARGIANLTRQDAYDIIAQLRVMGKNHGGGQ